MSFVYDHDHLARIIEKLGEAPDSQLDKSMTKLCREFNKENDDPVLLLRNILDRSIFAALASGGVVTLLQCLLEDRPEDSVEQSNRRRGLGIEMGNN